MNIQKCPYCNEELDIGFCATTHMRAYNGQCNVVTKCCGMLVYAVLHYVVTAVKSDKQTDDWGDIPKDIEYLSKIQNI